MDGLGWYGCTPCPSAGRGVKWLPRVRGCQTTHQRSCSMETTSIDPSVNGCGELTALIAECAAHDRSREHLFFNGLILEQPFCQP